MPPFNPLNPWAPKRPAYCASPLLREHRRSRMSRARARHALVAPTRCRFSTRDNTARRATRNTALSFASTTHPLKAPLARRRSLRRHRCAAATAGLFPVPVPARYASATLIAPVCRFLRCLQARSRRFPAARTIYSATARDRALNWAASCAARRQTKSPCLARTRPRHASTERDARVRDTHAQKARLRRVLAALRRCQRRRATIATAVLSIVVEVRRGPRRRRAAISHRLAFSAAFAASRVAFAVRHLVRATRFANVDARMPRE